MRRGCYYTPSKRHINSNPILGLREGDIRKGDIQERFLGSVVGIRICPIFSLSRAFYVMIFRPSESVDGHCEFLCFN
jgi:hypothetical protein